MALYNCFLWQSDPAIFTYMGTTLHATPDLNLSSKECWLLFSISILILNES